MKKSGEVNVNSGDFINHVYDGGRADSVYGDATRLINCGGATQE